MFLNQVNVDNVIQIYNAKLTDLTKIKVPLLQFRILIFAQLNHKMRSYKYTVSKYLTFSVKCTLFCNTHPA